MEMESTPIGAIQRSQGRQLFGADPARYDAARPDYPEGVHALLVDRCELRQGTRAFEIGAGTGKVTRQMLRRGACPIVAIEPDARLASFLASASASPSASGDMCLTVTVSPFEETDLPPAAFDLGAAATVFHWLDQDVALHKIMHAIRPGGWWAMWWNVFGDTARPDDFHGATQHLFASVEHTPSTGRNGSPHYALDTDTRIDTLRATNGFDIITHDLLRWTLTLSTDEVVALYATFSPVSRLAPAARERFLDALRQIADTHFSGRVERPMLTPIYTARRTA
jgi:SAM-dependent methyltransferase